MRKFIFLILLLIIASACYGQGTPSSAPTQTIRNKGAYVVDSGLKLPLRPLVEIVTSFNRVGWIFANNADSLLYYEKYGMANTWRVLTTHDSNRANGYTSKHYVDSIAGLMTVGTVSSVTAGDGLLGGVITGVGTISMPNVGIPTTWGNSTHVPQFTTDAQGRITNVVNVAIAGGGGGSGTVTAVTAGAGLSGGTITTSGTVSMPNVGTPATYGSATQVPVFTTDAQGRITGVTNTTISAVSPAGAPLVNGDFWVGNSSGIAVAVAPSGDVIFDNTGLFSIGALKVTNGMLAGSIAYTKLLLTNNIVNADIASAAAIAYSKLNLAASIQNSDIVNGTINLTTKVTGSLPPVNGGTGFSTYTLGDMIYSDATNSIAKLAGNITATKKFLTQTGTSSVSAAPSWGVLSSGDIPALAYTTSFSTGNLSPLFTASVTAATTAPALSFSLSASAAHTFFGNFTGSTGASSYGSPSLASADFANQGTTTTLLHGNASGNPSFAQVVGGDLSSTIVIPSGATATTQAPADNSTKLATTAYVDAGLTGKQATGNYVTYSDTTISAAYTLTARDLFRSIHCTNGSNIALTVPTGLGTTFRCEVIQEGAGTVTPTVSSTTFNFMPTSTTKTNGVGSIIFIRSWATANTYTIQGALQ